MTSRMFDIPIIREKSKKVKSKMSSDESAIAGIETTWQFVRSGIIFCTNFSDCQKSSVIPSQCAHSFALRAAYGGCATHSLRTYGVGIPPGFDGKRTENRPKNFGDCHTSLWAGSQ